MQAREEFSVFLEGLVKLNSDISELVSLLDKVDDDFAYLDAGLLADFGLNCVQERGVAELSRVVKDKVDKVFVKRWVGLQECVQKFMAHI